MPLEFEGKTSDLFFVDSPPAPAPYDPHFSKSVTVLSIIVLVVSIGLIAWLTVAIPALDRIAEPERALSLMVSRTMDVEEALTRAPSWERFLYSVAIGNSTHERDQAIVWYQELASYSENPLVDLNLAVLEGEAGHLSRLKENATQWLTREAPYPLFVRLVGASYFDTKLSLVVEQDLQAELAELVPAGWFYDRLAIRLAQGAGDRALMYATERASMSRGDVLLRRSRGFALVEFGLVLAGGGIVVVMWLRRRRPGATLRVGSATLPPRWPGGLGAAVLLRGGAVGAVLTMAFMFAAIDYASLRVVAIPLTNLPLVLLAYQHLLKPTGLSFGGGFGLRPASSQLGRLGLVILLVVALGLFGEWVLGQAAEPLNLSSHWTEWFDGDLVWAPAPTVAVSLLEYVVFAPVFEEIAFRGLLFGILRRRFTWVPAAVISASIFAIAHGYGLIGFVSVFLSGVIWAWAYEKSGSLLPGMIAHAINNLLVCLSVIALLRY